jgi:hypothetical protein
MEAGAIGGECLAPRATDDVHFCLDLLALTQPGAETADSGLPPTALLVSSLRDTASPILLNVSLGDQAVVEQRQCDCPKGQLGLTTILHTIRSFEKLTAGGMTFFDTDVIQILEELLPHRFGGGPNDYQLVEEETADGEPRMRLTVAPSVGPVDTREVAAVFRQALGDQPGIARTMALFWRRADFLLVERSQPIATASGKVQHLHLERRG